MIAIVIYELRVIPTPTMAVVADNAALVSRATLAQVPRGVPHKYLRGGALFFFCGKSLPEPRSGGPRRVPSSAFRAVTAGCLAVVISGVMIGALEAAQESRPAVLLRVAIGGAPPAEEGRPPPGS